ncbi:MAG: UDP-N-acetylglucosamine 2-epimerase (non-hydrolyzing) [Firmicutes bacterium]|nr:UDP-N-acetylglucosamine 2-epimerase (non-hydrolyzing) [Bacillota bacterium]
MSAPCVRGAAATPSREAAVSQKAGSRRAVSIASIVGARPQFVKAAMVSRALRALRDAGVQETLIHTGQHYDDNMSKVFFDDLEMPEPAVSLDIGSGGHGAQTGRMLEALERYLIDIKPDWVVVYGDTNSTLAGALAAAKIHLPVAHVEAGLRSFNRGMPEEINRVVADHLSDLLFVPTDAGVANLQREGIPADRVHLVGDVMYDAALYYGDRAERRSDVLRRLDLSSRGYVLATVHRAENTDDPVALRSIFEGLALAGREIPVVMPLHPRTRTRLAEHGLLDRYAGAVRLAEPCAGAVRLTEPHAGAAPLPRPHAGAVHLTDPVGYLDMLMLEKHARLIATDSGGVQKEAFFYSVPCVTLRGETEWTELVESEWNRLVPPRSASEVSQGIIESLDRRGTPVKPYGLGDASERIARVLVSNREPQDGN